MEKDKNILASIKKSIEDENVSYGEIAYLYSHQEDVKQYGDIVLAEWAGITEDEWNERENA